MNTDASPDSPSGRGASSASLLERLRRHATIGAAPVGELQWLIDHGEVRRAEKGEVITPGDMPVEWLIVLLSGHLAIHIERAYGRRKVMEWWDGDVTGVLPYSRMTVSPGDMRTVEPTEMLLVPQEYIPKLPAVCPEITAILVHAMTDRARHFTSADLHDQKALALGKVAAGLAHELNNPASALIRSAKTLAKTLEAQRVAAAPRRLTHLDDAALARVNRLCEACCEEPSLEWDALERADREEAIEEWLEGAGGDPAVAGVLAGTDLPLDTLFELVDALAPDAAGPTLTHVASEISVRRLAQEIEDGASGIFHLVSAVKRFTHLDQTMAIEPVTVQLGIEDAAALLAEKARGSGVTVRLDLPPGLPRVMGVVEELNQMWHALLDNAVEAAAPDGDVVVTGDADGHEVWVEIRDTGPGIPDEIRDRIFDPFFTTKPVGGGVGLGLELVRRVLDQHRGEIDVATAPDGTAFRVVLPTGDMPSSGSGGPVPLAQ